MYQFLVYSDVGDECWRQNVFQNHQNNENRRRHIDSVTNI